MPGAIADMRVFPEAASQSYKQGDFVELISGKVTQIVAASNTAGSSDKVLGMAMKDATGTTDADAPVLVANDSTLYLMPVWHTTPGSAVTAVTDVGTAFALGHRTVSSQTNYVITLDDTTDTHVVPVELSDDYAPGEVYGTEWVKIQAAARQFG